MPNIQVVIFQDDKWWVAQCLQYDIGAQADNPTEVLYQLERSLVGHVAICGHVGKEPFVDLPPAPQKYWSLWDGAKVTLQYDEALFRAPQPLDRKTVVRMAQPERALAA